jgi:glycosyltransferase involved in cell wall biosynthesis
MKGSGILISICIPTYKRPQYVERLLKSISTQRFKNYEVVITDDSPDNSLQEIVQKYSYLPIVYYKNDSAVGTPSNWNVGISKAKGEWIKLIHDDDWFSNQDSLQEFADATGKGKKFIFSSYKNVFEQNSTSELKLFPSQKKNSIIKNPLLLLAENIIGPPSVTLIHRSVTEQYDTNMKWRVDMDFYVRLLLHEKDFYAIQKPLINVGISESQVTNSCINVPEVELPEGYLLLAKYGVERLKSIRVYDAWWRIIRNVRVRDREELRKYTPYNEWPKAILKMADHQSHIPYSILKIGPCSKLFMFLSFLANYNNLKPSK